MKIMINLTVNGRTGVLRPRVQRRRIVIKKIIAHLDIVLSTKNYTEILEDSTRGWVIRERIIKKTTLR
jgi:hypothetical protein